MNLTFFLNFKLEVRLSPQRLERFLQKSAVQSECRRIVFHVALSLHSHCSADSFHTTKRPVEHLRRRGTGAYL